MKIQRKPDWLKIRMEAGEHYTEVKQTVEEHRLHTICDSGKCPNRNHCWSLGTATFMIMGDICTRSCKFCATKSGRPEPLDENEPEKIARSISLMKLKHCVLTSVDRDDLPDKGARHWAETVKAIRHFNPEVVIELLIPDYRETLLDIVLETSPDIVGHNLETVKRLTPSVRSRATYENSMEVLRSISRSGRVAKTGIMVGLGESQAEVADLMEECREAGCRMITIGQYLQPTKQNIEVSEYIHPDLFRYYKKMGEALGYESVESSPLVRSSYMAERSFLEALQTSGRR